MTTHHIKKSYSPNTKLSDLICENYDLLLVITRFGISLGFGEKSIREVCEDNKVNTNTLMAVINALINRPEHPSETVLSDLSAPSLINYLRKSHIIFSNFVCLCSVKTFWPHCPTVHPKWYSSFVNSMMSMWRKYAST